MAAGNSIDRAIILGAGKGSRLLPLTAERPKCLIDLSGRTLLEWQLDSLFEAGVTDMVVVTGYRPDLVEGVIAARGPGLGSVSTIFNPFYHVADNLGSAWMARLAMDRDFLLLNGDTLIPPELVERLIAAPPAPICVAVDRKAHYDEDDMKVLCEGDRLVRIDKQLAAPDYNAESIGFLRFMGEGRSTFVDTVEQMMRTPEGTSSFYLRAIDRLADTGIVRVAPIDGLEWAEVDYPADVEVARRLTGRWAEALAGAGPFRAEPLD
ncbi:MAG TPA: phosphocholine cytidylyltransferase family protein [Allosphingosinicella sp.]|nr:phosphocholine cytidylyltransferase family protein [Allosphingosinicella sp.]